MTASTFVVKAPGYIQSPEGTWATEFTVTRTMTTATTDDRTPLVTKYAEQKDVVLILTENMAAKLQEVIEDSAHPTCAQLKNLKRQANPGGEELCGYAGAAGAAQPGLPLEDFLAIRNPLNFVLAFQAADVVRVFAAAMAMMQNMVGLPTDLRYHAVRAAPWMFMLVFLWVQKKQRVATANTVSSEWLDSVTNSPTPTRTSTTSSSSSSSSKKPCRTDVLEVERSTEPDCVDGDCNGLNVDKKCTATGAKKDCLCWLWFEVTGTPQIMDPNFLDNLLLWGAAYQPRVHTIDKFGDYKAKAPIKGVDDFAFEFRWTRKQTACERWWTDPKQECLSWYSAFTTNENCSDTYLSSLKQYGSVDFECGIAEYFIDNHAQDEKTTGGFVDPWRVRPAMAKCSGSSKILHLDLWHHIANEWCGFLGRGFSTQATIKLWTMKDWWGPDLTTFPKAWGEDAREYTYHLRWKPKIGPACEVEQWPGFYRDVCVNTYVGFDNTHCRAKADSNLRLWSGTIETSCGNAWYFLESRGSHQESLDMIHDPKKIPYEFAGKDEGILTPFWKLTTYLTWNSGVEGGRLETSKPRLTFVSFELFNHYQESMGSRMISEKNGGASFTTATGNLTLTNFDFDPGDKQIRPVILWWWNSNNTAHSFGLRRGDGMIFKNDAWDAQNKDRAKVDENVDEPYADPLNTEDRFRGIGLSRISLQLEDHAVNPPDSVDVPYSLNEQDAGAVTILEYWTVAARIGAGNRAYTFE
ncbi:hypothetical protein BLS_007440 [Venturia inaequalis]|uniref:Uncharacterized protein n=1 Tax=Venturia inaequalis TaxID=5025 RepID=A0A8H3UBK0_VENIN|nr:hypothetical protein BLS_007440 [Venturia inaequalis]